MPGAQFGTTTGLIVTIGGTVYNVTTSPDLGTVDSLPTAYGTVKRPMMLPYVAILGPDDGSDQAIVGKSALQVSGSVSASTSTDAPGVSGVNTSTAGGNGVFGSSVNGDGVHGKTSNGGMSGVVGENTGGGKAGYFVGPVQVNGGSAATGLLVTSVNGDGIHGKANDSTKTAVIGEHTGGGKAGYFNGPVQVDGGLEVNGNLEVQGDQSCSGTLSVTKDIIMPFSADFAEDFQVEMGESVGPGTVMVLNDNGVLRPCGDSYDRKVAGVISGAGEYRPGLISTDRCTR